MDKAGGQVQEEDIDDIVKAIELSKASAKQEEDMRKAEEQSQIQAVKDEQLRVKKNAGSNDDFFDFDNDGFAALAKIQKQEEKKDDDAFDFNFGANEVKNKSAAPQESSDLLDLFSSKYDEQPQGKEQQKENVTPVAHPNPFENTKSAFEMAYQGNNVNNR